MSLSDRSLILVSHLISHPVIQTVHQLSWWCKVASVESFKADVLSISPSSFTLTLSEALYGGQFTLSTHLIKPKLSCYTPSPTEHHSVFRNLAPQYTSWLTDQSVQMSGNQPAMQPVSLSFTLWVSLSVIHTESEWVGESVSYSVHHLVHKSKSTSPLVRDYKSSQLLYNSLLTDVQTHPQQLSSCKAVWVKLDWGRENILPKQQLPLWPKQSSSQNIQHTHCISFFSFVWDQIFASQIKTKEDIFLRWNWLPYGSALNSPCLA